MEQTQKDKKKVKVIRLFSLLLPCTGESSRADHRHAHGLQTASRLISSRMHACNSPGCLSHTEISGELASLWATLFPLTSVLSEPDACLTQSTSWSYFLSASEMM